MVVMDMDSVAFADTFRADSLCHVVDAIHLETVWVIHLGYGQLFKTECAVTGLTVKMYVAVIINIPVRTAEFVSYTLAAVINLMEQVLLLEKHQSTEYARLINGVNLILQLGHSDGVVKLS
jgi:hypothetical protein